MITITIGNDSRSDSNISESWINQQINKRRRDGVPICVVFEFKRPGIDVVLRTPDCGQAGGGGVRLPNSRENQVFELWERMHLNSTGFTGGNVVAFLKQVERL